MKPQYHFYFFINPLSEQIQMILINKDDDDGIASEVAN
jgi:hypothetical protein